MKILLVNKFFYLKGGSEHVFFRTAELLKNKGHEIIFFSMENPCNFNSADKKYFVKRIDYEHSGIINKISSSLKLLYSLEAKNKIRVLLKNEHLHLAHLHNIYHQISPSILHSLKEFNLPVIITLHDYKMVCASHALLANGKICQACKGGRYYECLVKKCVRDSRMKSLINTIEMYLHQNILHIYDLVDIFISPSRFLKLKLEEMGFKGKIVYLPNFVNLNEFKPKFGWEEKSVVYLGRLSKEKGLFPLIDAARNVKAVSFKIIGDGPIKSILEEKVKKENIKNVYFLGYKTGEELKDEIRRSMFIVLPSECVENNPMSIIEGFALGKPALGSRIGGIPELIRDNITGLTFQVGNEDDLSLKIEYLVSNPDEIIEMGKNARLYVEQELSTEKHYQGLMQIYRQLIESKTLKK